MNSIGNFIYIYPKEEMVRDKSAAPRSIEESTYVKYL